MIHFIHALRQFTYAEGESLEHIYGAPCRSNVLPIAWTWWLEDEPNRQAVMDLLLLMSNDYPYFGALPRRGPDAITSLAEIRSINELLRRAKTSLTPFLAPGQRLRALLR
eukprot:scaffold128_cov248-Pinguiococcus_pyrenoidosus.AAC.13